MDIYWAGSILIISIGSYPTIPRSYDREVLVYKPLFGHRQGKGDSSLVSGGDYFEQVRNLMCLLLFHDSAKRPGG